MQIENIIPYATNMKPNEDNSGVGEENIDTMEYTDKAQTEDLNGNMLRKTSVTVVVSRMKGNIVNEIKCILCVFFIFFYGRKFAWNFFFK